MSSRSRGVPPGLLLVAAAGLAVPANLPSCHHTDPAPAGEPSRAPAPALGPEAGGAAAPQSSGRAQELYERQCAACHGQRGKGDGEAAYLLSPAPRDFTSARFRLVSTANGVPTHEDLVATLKRGMPGSAMPPWEWMPAQDLDGLADYVLELAYEGRVAALLDWAAQEDEELGEEEAREIARSKLAPGDLVDVGAAAPGDPATLQEGRRLYVKWCAPCHGADGTGSGVEEQWNEDGSPTGPRDFTAGIFKGGTTHTDLVRRLLAGMPGSPMPQATLDDSSQAALIAAYVQSLIKPGAMQKVQQRRQILTAAATRAALPREPADPAWSAAPRAYVALMPLWWRDDRVEGVVFQALHDGRELALRLSWEDAAQDDVLLGQPVFSDSAAIQLSADADPPLFAMGDAGRPVEIALWKAAWELDREGARDVEDHFPHTMLDNRADVPEEMRSLFVTARAVGNRQAAAERPTPAETLSAEGFGTLAPLGPERSCWSARAAWADGFWDVVFTRSLAASAAGEVALSPGATVHVAFAVWDGAAGDRDGQKSISIWHQLEIAR